MHLWQIHFGWPGGDVYGNLIASGVCAGLVWWRARVHLRRHARRHEDKHAETHQLLRDLHNRLTPPEDET